MSLHEYLDSKRIADLRPPAAFYALIMAAIRDADSENEMKLRTMWPEVWAEMRARYNAPGGRLPDDPTCTSPDDLTVDDLTVGELLAECEAWEAKAQRLGDELVKLKRAAAERLAARRRDAGMEESK